MSLQPYARNIALHSRNVRSFAAAAQKRSDAESAPFLPREELKTSKVNQITVASVETNKPISKIAVYFKAGSRYETDSTQGLVHMLRICAGLGTSGASQFGITRNIDAAGGNLTCTSGREFIAYTLEASRDKISSIDRFLQDVAVNQAFKPWEVKDNVHRARIERGMRSPEVRVLELIHKAAFRKGLGYSLFSPKWMLGNHSSEMLQSFVKSNFVEASVVAVGMPHEQAVDFASRLNLKPSGSGQSSAPSKFNAGSDIRKETSDNLAYVALAVEGPSISDAKKSTAATLVHLALGAPARTSHGLAPGGKLLAAVGESEVEATAVGFNANYSDTGLIGAYIAASPKKIESITKKAAEILQNVKFTQEDATRTKGILKGDIALNNETDGGLLEVLGVQGLLTGKPLTLSEQLSLVDSVSADDMNAVITNRKLSMAVFGNVSNVPYLDSLK